MNAKWNLYLTCIVFTVRIFSFALGAFAFFALVLSSPFHALFWFRARKCESAKMQARPPLDINHTKYKIAVHLCSIFTVQEANTYFKSGGVQLLPEEELFRPPPGHIRQTPTGYA
jgi:hypothetical protein